MQRYGITIYSRAVADHNKTKFFRGVGVTETNLPKPKNITICSAEILDLDF